MQNFHRAHVAAAELLSQTNRILGRIDMLKRLLIDVDNPTYFKQIVSLVFILPGSIRDKSPEA